MISPSCLFVKKESAVFKKLLAGRMIGMILIFLSTFSQAQYGEQIKVMTYNACSWCNENTQYEDVIEVITDIDPDVSGYQEVDRNNSRTPLDVIQVLADGSNSYSEYGIALSNWNGGQYGIGMLFDHPPLVSRQLLIEYPQAENRVAMESEITMNGQRVRVLNTHIGIESAQTRENQVDEMLNWMDDTIDVSVPMLIMGDFNASQNSSVMQKYLDAGFAFVRDKNGNVPGYIDHILYRPANAWEVVDAGSPTHYVGSDHDPVWATLKLKDAVNVNGPKADFIADRTEIEIGESVSFTDLSLNIPTSWSWTFEGGNPQISSNQNPVVTYSNAGVYKVTLTVSNADGSNTKSVNQYIEVVDPNNVGDLCTSDPYDVSVAYDGGSTVSYNNKEWEAKWWTKGDLPGSSSNSQVWKEMGDCMITGVETMAGRGVQIYPNPFTNLITITGSSNSLQVKIYDVKGSLQLEDEIQNQSILNLTSFTSGVYFVEVRTETSLERRRVVKK